MAIVFAGIKHCGKSTQAQALAGLMGRPYFDSDLLMEEFYHQEFDLPHGEVTVRLIMQKHGEEFFRRYEADSLRRFMFHPAASRSVLSLGGGVVTNPNLTRDELKSLGFIVMLDLAPEIAYARIAKEGLPPFLTGCDDPEAKFLKLAAERRAACLALSDAVIALPEELPAQEVTKLVTDTLRAHQVMQ